MTYDEAIEILLANLEGKYRGERSRLIRATEVASGDMEPCEEVETVWGTFDVGIDVGGEG